MRFFNIHSVAKHEKIEEKFFFYFREKISQCRKKLKGGTLWDFPTSILSQNIKKCRGPFEEKKFEKKDSEKKCLAVPKKIERGDSLVSPGMVCYAEKQVKPFWSSSLGQMVQFDTIIFCRTFKNYFGQFVWIEKKRVTIIVAFHFMKRRLKMDRVARRGSLARAAGALKSHNAEKLKGGHFEVFQHAFCRKTSKKMQGGPFGENFFFRKKSLAVPEKMKGGTLWSRPVWYITRKNRKNFFGSVR